MMIENVRIAILDAYDNVLTFMDNLLPKALHYYDDTLHEYLKGSTYTYSFSASADHSDSQYLVEGNKLAFVYREKNYYLTIMTAEKDEYTVTCEAFGLPFELLNEDKEAYAAPEAMTFEEYLAVFDPEGIITLGLNEVSDKSITHEWTGTESMLARLYSLATAFDAEVEFQAVLHDNYSLAGIILNVYKEHGDGSQGMGENRMDTILRYGKEVDGVRKTADISELYTAIRPTGKNGLDITSIEINEYDENGNLEYSSPQGNRNIYAVQAKDRFPSNLTAPATERYTALVWSYDTDNVNVLAGQALARLKEVCVPNVRYEVSGYVDANIGDTFVIQDEEYTPQLLLSARVTEQERSFTDPSQNKTVFDNFTELESQISEDLLGRVEELIQANKSYSAYIDSNNGLVFKNNTGSTTLTATITSGTEDVTADMTVKWFKDNSAAGSGNTLTVNASDIEETAVYSIQAVNGNGDIVATAQVTIADVYDGAAGQPGPAGTSSYTHIAYANSADGTVDFSVTDSNREYIGFYVDNVQAGSTDPSKYKWTLIKGADGSQGVPGTPGADGRTPYFHIAYANSADGQTDFSTTDSAGRAYMGTCVDFNQTDPTDPTLYTWVKVQGETGPEGQPGQDGEPGKDGKMLYATSLSLASYATKEAYLQGDQTITDEDLYVGITVSVMFDSGNTASNPQLKLSECSAYPIMCQGLNYAYWRNDQTVVFTWDGTYWRVASEPVYAAMVLVGSATGKNVYVSSSGVAVRDGSEILALYGDTTDIGKTDEQHVHIDTDSVDVMDGNKVLASFGANTIIGDPDGLHTEIGETGFEIAYPISIGTGDPIFDRLRLSPGGIAIKTGEETSDDFLQFVIFNTVTDKTDIPGLQKNGFDVPNTRDIQSGISGNYQVASGQNVQVNVTFPNEYPVGVEPVVVCTAMPATNNQASFESGILNVSRLGFTALVTNRGNSNYTIKLAWISMTPTE